MALGDLNDRQAVVAALDEAAEIGREPFLAKYRFGKATRYMVRWGDQVFDSKAIAGAAHGYQFGRQLDKDELSGGVDHAAAALRRLGFEIVDTRQTVKPAPALVERSDLDDGQVYTWEDLADRFGFAPGWLNRTGGMGSLPQHNAVLIVTHPGGGKSFDYDDYWDGADLIYTGKGQVGNQQRTAENRYVGDNSRTVLAFEQAGPAKLRYLGSPVCVDEWPETAPDRNGNPRRIIRFRLRFESRPTDGGDGGNTGARPPSADPDRRSRPFDSSRPPRPRATNNRKRRDPAETAALQEKAVQGHHALVTILNQALLTAGWTEVGEIALAIDLWGRDPHGARTIFEVKTLRPASELSRVRDAISQLLEYRIFFGAPDDALCIVTDNPLSDKRVRLLRALGIAVVVIDGDRLVPGSPDARERLPSLLGAN